MLLISVEFVYIRVDCGFSLSDFIFLNSNSWSPIAQQKLIIGLGIRWGEKKLLLEAVVHSKASGNVKGVLVQRGWDSLMQWTLSVYTSKKTQKLLTQTSGLVLDILSQIAAIHSGEKEMWSGSQPGMLSPTSRAPQKIIFRQFPVWASIPCQCVRLELAQVPTLPKDCHSPFALPHLLRGTFGLYLCSCQAFSLRRQESLLWEARAGCHTAHFTGFIFYRLQAPYSLQWKCKPSRFQGLIFTLYKNLPCYIP